MSSAEEAFDLQFNVKNIVAILAEVEYCKLPILAVQLGLEKERSEIEDETIPYQRRKALTDAWLKKKGEDANWEELANALCHPSIEENVLARKVEDHYMRRGSRTSSIASSRSTPSSPAPLSPPSVYAVRDLKLKGKVADKLREATEEGMIESFASLKALFVEKLSQLDLNSKSFCSYVTTIFQQRSIPLTIPETSDISAIIDSVSLHWGYSNYKDIERITTRYLPTDEDLRSAISEHKDMVNNYHATRHIADYIEGKVVEEFRTLKKSYHGRRDRRNYYDTLSLKLDDVNIEMKTLKYIRDLWKDLKREFRLPDCNALLDHIYRSCIVVVWLIPSPVSEVMKRPQPWSAICFLQGVLASRMMLNETYCVYDKEDSMKLLALSSEGNFEEVSLLLRSEGKGAAVNATFTEMLEGKSALILASEGGHEMVMFNLLDRNGEADVNFSLETSGKSALFFAAENGHDAAIAILLAYGADPFLTDREGETAYSIAKRKLGNEKVCEELRQIESKKQLAVKSISTSQRISESFEGARTTVFRPFYQAYQQLTSDLVGAARNDNLDIVQYILKYKKSDVNARESDKHGWTPLMWASERGNFEMVDLLLKKGADPNLATKGSKWTPLMLASRRDHLKIAKLLLDKQSDPNAQNVEGVSALAIAAYENRTAVAMLLIYRGANIHLPAYNGWTPLIRASNEGNLKLMKLIADLGAYLNDQTEQGWTSLMVASHYDHVDVVKELAKRRADLDLQTDDGDTALHIASLQDHPGVVKELANSGANLDITNKDGLTALMVGANKGYLSVVEVLLEGGADVNHQHKATGWTAIFFAAKNDRVDILKSMLLHGAKSELDDGTNLIDVASHLKQPHIIDVLGTPVDKGQTVVGKDTGFQDVANTLDGLVQSLEDRFIGLAKRL